MPYLKLKTNISINTPDTSELLKQLSELMAKQTGKPESYVMVEVESAQSLLFAGSDAPTAYLECKSIGLRDNQTKPLAAAICQLLHTRLKIEPARIYIEFADCAASYWGWNGSTFG